MPDKPKTIPNPKTLVIIPAYNEANRIEPVLQDLKNHGFENIIVIDDGSSDETFAKAKSLKVQTLQHAINRGMGASTQTGVAWGVAHKFDYFLTIDGDGQQSASDLKKIHQALQKKQCVIGSRFLEFNNIPFFRRMANKIANIITGILFAVWVSDSQSGMRGFTYDVAKILDLHSDGFEFCSEFIREVRFAGFSIVEIPISVRYTRSTMKKGQNFAEGLKTLGKLCLRAIRH